MDLLCLLGRLLAERENTGSHAKRDFKGCVVLSETLKVEITGRTRSAVQEKALYIHFHIGKPLP